jgi:hypothetical protein
MCKKLLCRVGVHKYGDPQNIRWGRMPNLGIGMAAIAFLFGICSRPTYEVVCERCGKVKTIKGRW